MKLEPDQTRTIAAFAALAPSVHNTQPWRFVAIGPTIEVRAESGRQLDYLDATSRQLHISCGAAIEFARLAVRALGYDCVVRLAPRPDREPDLLATLTAGHRLPTSAGEQRLIEAIPRRYTDRGRYDDRPVPGDVLNRAREAAAERGCWLRLLDRPGDRVTVATLLADAEALEAADPRYRAELATWRHDRPASDGIPDDALPQWEPDRVSDLPLRDFSGGDRHREPDASEPPHVERDTVVLLGSDDDSVVAWLRTGRALALVLLTLTAAGVVTQPLGPVTDVPSTRTRLQQELGLLGRPQLMLRAGFGHGEPTTRRRSVEELLTAAS
jgi:hypothetical protein